ncbi:hypothetical protein H257_17484 [Aphanomyces astaci]|uniref:Uncharacterized protein n=1 Tax=Aphanomyces astaci TaxID=112090 RepID=W4FGG9_APHAT|nr:hypothetical protein H257_17484 [Aphanomyces astaci]ETV65941.1 hypothetical protein H257_17484 [Aphanomyces astaci]|eukprot:XP_009844596.1 hypothetical protein H257_17484 [Aphanomyces astaci]
MSCWRHPLENLGVLVILLACAWGFVVTSSASSTVAPPSTSLHVLHPPHPPPLPTAPSSPSSSSSTNSPLEVLVSQVAALRRDMADLRALIKDVCVQHT